jgi:hypothetical protein
MLIYFRELVAICRSSGAHRSDDCLSTEVGESKNTTLGTLPFQVVMGFDTGICWGPPNPLSIWLSGFPSQSMAMQKNLKN